MPTGLPLGEPSWIDVCDLESGECGPLDLISTAIIDGNPAGCDPEIAGVAVDQTTQCQATAPTPAPAVDPASCGCCLNIAGLPNNKFNGEYCPGGIENDAIRYVQCVTWAHALRAVVADAAAAAKQAHAASRAAGELVDSESLG